MKGSADSSVSKTSSISKLDMKQNSALKLEIVQSISSSEDSDKKRLLWNGRLPPEREVNEALYDSLFQFQEVMILELWWSQCDEIVRQYQANKSKSEELSKTSSASIVLTPAQIHSLLKWNGDSPASLQDVLHELVKQERIVSLQSLPVLSALVEYPSKNKMDDELSYMQWMKKQIKESNRWWPFGGSNSATASSGKPILMYQNYVPSAFAVKKQYTFRPSAADKARDVRAMFDSTDVSSSWVLVDALDFMVHDFMARVKAHVNQPDSMVSERMACLWTFVDLCDQFCGGNEQLCGVILTRLHGMRKCRLVQLSSPSSSPSSSLSSTAPVPASSDTTKMQKTQAADAQAASSTHLIGVKLDLFSGLDEKDMCKENSGRVNNASSSKFQFTRSDINLLELMMSKDALERSCQNLRQKIKLIRDRAQAALKNEAESEASRKAHARQLLQRKAEMERTLESQTQALMNMEKILHSVEMAETNHNIVAGMQAGHQVLEELNANMASTEEIDELMTDLSVELENVSSVSIAISQPVAEHLAIFNVDDGEIEDELSMLEKQMNLEKQASTVNGSGTSSPTAKKEQDMDDAVKEPMKSSEEENHVAVANDSADRFRVDAGEVSQWVSNVTTSQPADQTPIETAQQELDFSATPDKRTEPECVESQLELLLGLSSLSLQDQSAEKPVAVVATSEAGLADEVESKLSMSAASSATPAKYKPKLYSANPL